LTDPFGRFSLKDVGAVFKAPAAVGLHLATRDNYRGLQQSQKQAATGHQKITLFLSASSRGPQQERTLTKLALAGIFGLPWE
jgi:hypothetical protein